MELADALAPRHQPGQSRSGSSGVTASEATGQAGPQTLAEVVVTAEKRSQNIMNAPLAIAAFPASAMKAMGIQNTQYLQFAVPSLNYSNTGPYSEIYIRGIGSRLLQNGLDSSVATYVDGRYVARQSADAFDFTDVARVEVLEGPQGVLFGRNAVGGAIRVITNDVSNHFETNAAASVGNYGAWSASGMINDQLTDTLGVRLAVSTTQRDGIARNLFPTSGKWNNENFNEARGKVKWQPTDNFTAELTLGYVYRDDNQGNAYVSLGVLKWDPGIAEGGITGTNPYTVASAEKAVYDQDKESSTELDLTYRLRPFDVKSITTYAYMNNDIHDDSDGTSAILSDAYPIWEIPNTLTQEVDLTSNTQGPIDWLGGLYFYDDRTQYIVNDHTSPTETISDGNQIVDTKSYAGFGQVQWHITHGLAFVAGGRYTSETKDATLLAAGVPGAVLLVATPKTTHLSDDKFTPSATLKYNFAESMIYAKYAVGFVSGGFNYPFEGVPVVKPETLDMDEIGYKASLFHRAVELTASAYYYDMANLQVTRGPPPGSVSVVVANAASAVAHGVDAVIDWYVNNEFTVNSSLSWEESEYTSYIAGAYEYKGALTGTDEPGMSELDYNATGQPLLHAPKFGGFVTPTYKLQLGNGAEVPITLTYSYKTSYNFDFVTNPTMSVLRQGGHGVLNARIGYVPSSGNWSVSIYGNNILDKWYFNDVVASGTGIRGQFADPLTYGVEFTVSGG